MTDADPPAQTESHADDLREIAALVQAAAVRTSLLWRTDGFDGDRTARLIEASRALHRAAVALSDVSLIGYESGGTDGGEQPRGEGKGDDLRQAARAALVDAAVDAVANAPDLPAAFRSFVDIVRPRAAFDAACFAHRSLDEQLRVAVAEGSVDWRALEGRPVTDEGRRAWERFQSGASIVAVDTTRPSAEPVHQALAEAGVRSYLSVPVVAAGEVRAVVFFSAGRPRAFGGDGQKVLEDAVRATARAFHMLMLLDGEREAVARLRELSSLKDDFIATVVHDLRSPMTVISGLAGLLATETDLSDELRVTSLARIVANTKRLSTMVDAVLDVARLEAGGIAYEPTAFDLVALVRDLVDEAALAQPSRSYRLDAPGQLPQAFGDPDTYVRVVTNLLSNAVKFSGDDAPVEVAMAADGAHLRVAVQDHGPGIDEADLPRLFRRFSRVNGHGVGAPIPGTGLGLYISKQLVEAQGGRIWVQESTRGQGSCFYFTVPKAEEGQ
ncbi:MAG: sensor histidine kinase [Microthrixaceae bacterium]